MLDELFGVETGVGDVAASTAGDADFVEGMAAGFEEGDVEVGVVLGGGDGSKEAGGPTADDNDVGHWVRGLAGWFGKELSQEGVCSWGGLL